MRDFESRSNGVFGDLIVNRSTSERDQSGVESTRRELGVGGGNRRGRMPPPAPRPSNSRKLCFTCGSSGHLAFACSNVSAINVTRQVVPRRLKNSSKYTHYSINADDKPVTAEQNRDAALSFLSDLRRKKGENAHSEKLHRTPVTSASISGRVSGVTSARGNVMPEYVVGRTKKRVKRVHTTDDKGGADDKGTACRLKLDHLDLGVSDVTEQLNLEGGLVVGGGGETTCVFQGSSSSSSSGAGVVDVPLRPNEAKPKRKKTFRRKRRADDMEDE